MPFFKDIGTIAQFGTWPQVEKLNQLLLTKVGHKVPLQEY